MNEYSGNNILLSEWKQAFQGMSLEVSICRAVLFSDPLQPYYRGLPFKSITRVSQTAGQAISHATLQSDTTFIKLLHWAHKRTRTHTPSLQCQWPGKWNWGEGWYESVFAFEKPKVKLSDLDLWKWRREGGMGGERGRLAGEQECILMSWQQEHNSMTDCDGKKMGQAGNKGWCYPGPVLQQPC